MPAVQRATFIGGYLVTLWQFSSSYVYPWSRPGTSLEIRLRDDCSVWVRKIVWLSLVVDMLLFVDVFVILFDCKKMFAYWKIFGGYNIQNRQILVLLSNSFWGWILFPCIDSPIQIVVQVCIQFAFIEEDDILDRWLTIGEVPTLLKRASVL